MRRHLAPLLLLALAGCPESNASDTADPSPAEYNYGTFRNPIPQRIAKTDPVKPPPASALPPEEEKPKPPPKPKVDPCVRVCSDYNVAVAECSKWSEACDAKVRATKSFAHDECKNHDAACAEELRQAKALGKCDCE